jgi:multidrug efflux system outer membrane protein
MMSGSYGFGVGKRRVAAHRPGLVAMAVALMLAGCAAPPPLEHAAPVLELPAATQRGTAIDTAWWKSYGDTRLNALVDEALLHNRDLARAAARIDESRAALRLAGANRLPSVSAGVSSTRQRASETSAIPLGGASPVANNHRATLAVAYEVDLWSRLARTQDAARDDLLATTYARDTLRIALAAQVVQSYVALQALDAQVVLFGRTVEAQRHSVELQRKRFDAGDIGELDLRQLEAELIANEAQLPKLTRARGDAQRALAFVLGRSPRELVDGAVVRADTPAAIPVGDELPGALPSDLLEHRPDVQAASARLRAAGARVDAARAAYFPSISLSASIGGESADLSKLTNGSSLIWGVLASLTQPIWDGGRIDASNDLARARRREIEVSYRDTVANAFKEASDALAARTETEQSLRNASDRERALAQAARLTKLRFDGGEESRIELIRAERVELAAQSELVDARRAVAAAQADLFRVLGGGWAGASTDLAAASAVSASN